MSRMQTNTATKSFAYRILENFGTQGISFVISIVLARLLIPEDYGIVAIASPIVAILTAVVQSSFNTPLVQKKEFNEKDKSTSFYMMLLISVIVYLVMFIIAPAIEVIYGVKEVAAVIRTMSIILIIGPWNSVNIALMHRSMKFRESFYISVVANAFQGLIGIVFAYFGFGVWSLVFSQVSHQLVSAIAYGVCNKWYPKFIFSIPALKSIWRMGLPLWGAELVTIISTNINPMIIGLFYTKVDLGLYQKGCSLPTTIVNGIVSACSTVFLPIMSRMQDSEQRIKELLRKGVRIISFLVVPIALGLCAISRDFVLVILGEQWEKTIIYMQIACVSLALYPLRIKLQAIKALGNAKQSLYINLLHAFASIVLLAMFVRKSMIHVAVTQVIAEFIFAMLSARTLSRSIGYTYAEQLVDILPNYVLSVIMCLSVLGLEKLFTTPTFLSLIVKVLVGIVVYVILSFVGNIKAKNDICKYIQKHRVNNDCLT